MSKTSFAALMLALLLIIVPISVLAQSDEAPDDQVTDGVVSVLPNKKGTKLTVTVTLTEQFLDKNPKAELFLFMLSPGEDLSTTASLPIESFKATAKRSFSLELTENSLYACYLIATRRADGSYSAVGAKKYVTDLPSIAAESYPYPKTSSIKGLVVSSVSDALALGVSHAVLPVAIETMHAEVGDRAIPFDMCGQTVFFNAEAVEKLDDDVLALSREGVRVYLRFELNTAPAALSPELAPLGYADSPAAEHYAIRVDSAAAARYMEALTAFLARRYTDPAATYGFCGSFIIGNAVNLPSTNYAASPLVTAEQNAAYYADLVRIAHTSLCSAYSLGKVYISLSNNFSMVPGGMTGSDVSLTEFLAAFNSAVTEQGDFGWAIAADAYAYSRSDTTIWDDALATGASSQLISPANVNVLSYALTRAYNFEGQPRSLIIGNFAVPTVDEPDVQALRAASYAYGYYKVLEDGVAEALIYSEQFDTPSDTEGFGLSTVDMSGNVLKRNDIWHTMRRVNTQATQTIADSAASLGGVVQFIYSSMHDEAAVCHLVDGTADYSAEALASLKLTPLFDFTSGDRCGFVTSGYGYPTVPKLVRNTDSSALRLEGGSEIMLYRDGISAGDLGSCRRLVVTLDDCSSGTMMLRLHAKDGSVVYSCSVSYPASCGAIVFDISDLRGQLKGDLSLSLSLLSPTEFACIASISAASSTSMPTWLWITLLVLGILLAIFIVLALFGRLVVHRRRRS